MGRGRGVFRFGYFRGHLWGDSRPSGRTLGSYDGFATSVILMTFRDLLRFAGGAVMANRLRSSLSLLGIAIGVGAVILLTSIGEGTRQYILSQFTQFGTNLLAINPGKIKTFGVPGVLGGTTHKLTLGDAEAVRRIPGKGA